MSATPASRTLFRRTPQLVIRRRGVRSASSTSQATEAASNTASKAKEQASHATGKASEGLSRVTSSAGSGISRMGGAVGRVLGGIGGRTGRLIGFVQSMIPPTIYYSRVGLELSKLVFQGRKMTPPDVAAFQSYLTPIVHTLRNPSSLMSSAPSSARMTPEAVLSRIRNMDRAQLVSAGVLTAEVLGFFTVGEMAGRLKLVGYNGDVHHHETATPHEAL
ncbi:hypothetical protein MMC19_004893 [Ptychographa xylographoides]|nr:hypothetical protein [Ptychographa xylographoides]